MSSPSVKWISYFLIIPLVSSGFLHCRINRVPSFSLTDNSRGGEGAKRDTYKIGKTSFQVLTKPPEFCLVDPKK